jgi:hydroxypyruvate isomerase
MFELSACIEWLFSEAGDDFEARIRAAANAGVPAVEFWGWRSRDIDGIADALRETGVEVSGFATDPALPLGDRSAHDDVVTAIAESAAVARTLGARNLIVVSGDTDERFGPDEQRAAIVDVLRRAAPVAAGRDVVLLVEPLNTRVDHVGTFLDSTDEGFRIVDDVGEPNVKLLFDLYHSAVMGEDVELVLRSRIGDVGHIHIADTPGRHEPGTGTIDWTRVFASLSGQGYAGRIGLEYLPLASTTDSLAAVRRFMS